MRLSPCGEFNEKMLHYAIFGFEALEPLSKTLKNLPEYSGKENATTTSKALRLYNEGFCRLKALYFDFVFRRKQNCC